MHQQAYVAYPNRDSTPFREFYQIPEAETVVRGTLRYQGFPAFIKTLVEIGFLNETPIEWLNPAKTEAGLAWNELSKRALGAKGSDEEFVLLLVFSHLGVKKLIWSFGRSLVERIKALAVFSSPEEEQRIISGLKWIGFFSSEEKVVPRGNLLDTLCATLEPKMQYEKGERDMVILQHKFEIENKDGSKVCYLSLVLASKRANDGFFSGEQEVRTSTLLDFGKPVGSGTGPSSMVCFPYPVATCEQVLMFPYLLRPSWLVYLAVSPFSSFLTVLSIHLVSFVLTPGISLILSWLKLRRKVSLWLRGSFD